VMAIGRGRWFVSANIRPELMKPADWDFLAALIRWQRHNQRHLVDARMFGGNPASREAYGYVFHNADKDLFCIRNPWMEVRTIRLPARVTEARDLRMIYPRRAGVGRLNPNEDGPAIVLGPYETMFLETVPAAGENVAAAMDDLAATRATLVAEEPQIFQDTGSNAGRGFDFYWTGELTVPDVRDAELCILVEGGPEIAKANGGAWINGRPVQIVRTGSAGQFGAAVEASPENWVWLVAPIEAGEHEFGVVLSVPADKAAIGVYLRGNVPATSDPARGDGPAFPLYRADTRPWSQTLQPLKSFGGAAPGDAGT
jgi:hypothetical protein